MASRSTVVRASAGTGKTRKLVEIYLQLLDSGTDPLHIVAITFTEKAAAEMRERICNAIYAKLDTVPQDAKGRWMRMVGVLPAAPISTIHSFCGSLLRENSLKLGVDPSFTILDEQHRLDLEYEAALETIRREIRLGNEGAERLFGDLGLDRLVTTIADAGRWLSSLGRDAHWLESAVADQRRAGSVLERELADEIRRYGCDFDKIGETADRVQRSRGRHPLKKRDDPQALLSKVGQIAGIETAASLSELVCGAIELCRVKKRKLNALDFDDLLIGARDLLKERADIRERYDRQFEAILVDEFQDTDDVQAEIIRLLTANPAKTLFVVGDPKQSIYRFRRSRVTAFFQMLRDVVDNGGTLEHLRDNYRSAAPLVELSNRLSARVMDGAGKKTLTQTDTTDLSYRIRFSDADFLVAKSEAPFLGIVYIAAKAGARGRDGRLMEAEAIARMLKELKSEGKIQKWQDAAMLLRTTNNAHRYADALETHGIPVCVTQGTRFYLKSEVSDLIALLELVLHPEDKLIRATVLSSALAGVTFREMLVTENSLRLPPRFEKIIQPWIDKRDSATAAEILQDIIRKTNFDVVIMAQKNGRQRVENIGKLIEITRKLARQGTTGLEEVVRYLRRRALDMTVREPEAQVLAQDDDVVRILTVHQAKGLEFDVVILPDLAARTGRSGSVRVFFSERWGILAGAAYGMHRRALPHSLILTEKDWENDQQYEEEKRLLYVAVTRARKMLIFGEGSSRQPGLWQRWVSGLLDSARPGAIEMARKGKSCSVRFRGQHDFSVRVLPASKLAAPEQLTLDTAAIHAGQVSPRPEGGYRRPIERSAMEGARGERAPLRTLDLTPSDLSSLGGCFRYFHWTRIQGLAEPGKKTTGDTPEMRLGATAHKLLESGVPHSAETLVRFGLNDLSAVFDSSEWKELTARFPEREMPFMMKLDVDGIDCWIRGRMDAVVLGDMPRVIDYKYAAWKAGAEDNYDVQMTAYSLALMKSAGTIQAIADLWYLKEPMKIVRRVHTRPEAEERLTGLIRRYVSAIESGHWQPADSAYCDLIECGFRSQCWGVNGSSFGSPE